MLKEEQKNIEKMDDKASDAILNRFLEILYYQLRKEEFNQITNSDLNITSKEWNYLVWFSRYPSLSITKLSKKFLISKSTLSLGLKTLMKNNLVKKSALKDARYIKLKLTTEGKRYVQIHNEIEQTIKEDLIKNISLDDYDVLINIAKKMLLKTK